MRLWQAILFLASVVLLVLAALGVSARVNLALLGAACFVLAYALPTIAAL